MSPERASESSTKTTASRAFSSHVSAPNASERASDRLRARASFIYYEDHVPRQRDMKIRHGPRLSSITRVTLVERRRRPIWSEMRPAERVFARRTFAKMRSREKKSPLGESASERERN